MSLAVLILFCFFTIIFSQADFECLMTRSHVTSLDSQICVFAKANIHSNILSVYTVEVHVLWEMKSWSENQKSQRCSSLTWAHLYILKKKAIWIKMLHEGLREHSEKLLLIFH